MSVYLPGKELAPGGRSRLLTLTPPPGWGAVSAWGWAAQTGMGGERSEGSRGSGWAGDEPQEGGSSPLSSSLLLPSPDYPTFLQIPPLPHFPSSFLSEKPGLEKPPSPRPTTHMGKLRRGPAKIVRLCLSSVFKVQGCGITLS